MALLQIYTLSTLPIREVPYSMKSQKRNHADRAYGKGYQAGISGRSRDLCPHEGGVARHEWISGWREGREDHWSGFNRAAQAQKLSNF